MNPPTPNPDVLARFSRKGPGLIDLVRRPLPMALCLLALVGYAFLLLPEQFSENRAWYYTSIYLFITLTLGFSSIILSDRHKPEYLKMAVSLLLIFTLGWLFYLYSGAQWGRLANFFFNWKKLEGNWWILGDGLLVTLGLAAVSAVGSLVVGLAVAILRAYSNPTLNIFLKAYVDVFRSIPMIVFMVILFFALPFAGISLGSILSTVVALSFGYGAYTAESFRAGIESVHSGQIEAARSLGLSRWQTIRKIILPQAIPVVIPPLTGNLVAMLKDTAVASVVAAPELLKRARELYTSKTNPTPLVAASLMYLAVLIPLVRVVNILEGRMKIRKR
jgi:polar amino acid transport system permease protein